MPSLPEWYELLDGILRPTTNVPDWIVRERPDKSVEVDSRTVRQEMNRHSATALSLRRSNYRVLAYLGGEYVHFYVIPIQS